QCCLVQCCPWECRLLLSGGAVRTTGPRLLLVYVRYPSRQLAGWKNTSLTRKANNLNGGVCML
ncbi:MAG: hypothetical protein AAFN68_05685, partial [Pseudomonadota bacterium]